jgi:hypothetical protein
LRLGAAEKNYDILRLMVSRYDMVLEILLSVFLGFLEPQRPFAGSGCLYSGLWNSARHERRVRPVSLIIDESFPDSMSWAMSRAKFPAL